MNITDPLVRQAITLHMPERTVERIEDLGVWIRRNFRITLDGGEIVYLKVDDQFTASAKEAYICDLLDRNNLPAPRVVACDISRTLLPNPYILQKHLGGVRLTHLLERENPDELQSLYRSLGRFYRKLHNVHHPYSGWIDGPDLIFQRSPNDYQFNEVMVRIGGEAVSRNLLPAAAHERLMQLWSDHLTWLDQHQPSLVGGSLPWTLYLEKKDGEWQVVKLTDLEDMLYWDPAWDLTNIRYPAFGEDLSPALWAAFKEGYGDLPGEKRLKLYMLMQRLDAAMGNYMEPPSPRNAEWKAAVWEAFPALLDEVAAMNE